MHNSRHWVLSNMVVGCNSSVNESLFGIEYKIVFFKPMQLIVKNVASSRFDL